jgi:hypothetical protein
MGKIRLISMAVVIPAALYSQTAFSQTAFLVCKSEHVEIPLKIDYNNRMVSAGDARIPAQITDTTISFQTDKLLVAGSIYNYNINRLNGSFVISDPQNGLKPEIGHCQVVQPF